ncbi:hypothetical protein [Agrobacterium tumefaciens]|uniref:hypothetical protein n=1 Tax=Agrobacterium tumefaciens TaxID=358 RepID=UPI003BA154F6
MDAFQSSSAAIIYSSNVHAAAHAEPRWLIGKDRPVSDVVDAIVSAMRDPAWVAKAGETLG